jgi:hypothetical protein
MHPIDREFFEQNLGQCATWSEWEDWLQQRKRTDDARLRRFLQLATGLSPSALTHYVNGRRERLSTRKLEELDRIASMLGRPDLIGGAASSAPQIPTPRRHRRIALMTELDVPSRAFHARVTRALAKEAASHGAVLSIHETDRYRLAGSVADQVMSNPPHAVLFLRLTPTAEVLAPLRARGIPAIVIHGDRLSYPAPVLASISPTHESIETQLKAWIGELRPAVEHPVLVMLHDENPQPVPDGWLLPGVERVLRADRSRRLLQAIEQACKRSATVVHLEDCSHLRAFEVYDKHADEGDLFIVLSDEVALALHGLLKRTSRQHTPVVVGYDFSNDTHGVIPSFDQKLDLIAPDAITQLATFWSVGTNTRWPERCREILHETVLHTVPILR